MTGFTHYIEIYIILNKKPFAHKTQMLFFVFNFLSIFAQWVYLDTFLFLIFKFVAFI